MIGRIVAAATLTFACFALTVGVATAQGVPNSSNDVARARVEKVVNDIIAADMAGDLDTVMSLYSDDAILLPPGGPDIKGNEAIRSHYERLFAATDLEIENETHETIVSGNLAMTRGVNRVTAIPKAGGPAKFGRDKYVMVLEKDVAGSWRISHLIWAPQPD